MKYTESDLEKATLEWLEGLGYQIIYGPDIEPDGGKPERKSYGDVILVDRLQAAISRINPSIPQSFQEEALKKVLQATNITPKLIDNNKLFHAMLRDGVDIEYQRADLPASRPGIFYVYAILCDNNSIYIGQTENLENRWDEHVKGRASDHTRKFKPRLLIHYEELNSREETVAREKWLKTGFGRKWLRREWEAGRTRQAGGTIAGDKVYLVDHEHLENNDWLVVNQFTAVDLPARGAQAGNHHNRRPDVVVFVNGIPLALFELKNPGDEKAKVISESDEKSAFNQIQTYKDEIPSLLTYNELVIIGDGLDTRIGTITSSKEWFTRWRTIDGKTLAPKTSPQIEVLLKGVFDKRRLLDIISYFLVYESHKDSKNEISSIEKKLAAYHQYHATNKAVEKAVEAVDNKDDKRCGVVWHTQGSGKSLTMVFFSGKITQALHNPTIVVITDRNDLDGQLFGTFCRCSELLRQTPRQAESREQLKEYLRVASGGVVFTTIQKFLFEGSSQFPLLSDRENIVVIADEAHRTQYGFIGGLARHMRSALPNASFIGFTGTPIELSDRNTRAVFGEYIDVYDVSRAVEDKTTVPIYYEARLAKIALKEEERPKIDPEFEELTEGEEIERKEKLKSKWARLEAMVGAEKRITLIAQDIIDHFENRLSTLEGKGMIVVMSRRIAVDLYNELIKLRPQ